MKTYTPIVVVTALSLYAFNVGPCERANKLHAHFAGDCLDIEELIRILVEEGASVIGQLPYPTAKVYIDHALERYGQEAEHRCEIEEKGLKYILGGF
jgi:hypothetical protein